MHFFICNIATLLFVVKSVQTISHRRMERNTLSCRNNTWNLNLAAAMDQHLTPLDTKRFLSDNYTSSSVRGQKLLRHDAVMHATAGQRLALALVSLVLFMILIFGLVLIAVASNADNWVVLPILFILILYSALAACINIVFNQS